MFDTQLMRHQLAQQLCEPVDLLFITDFCPRCQDMLPLFISDEMADRAVDRIYPDVAYHLDLCLNCLVEYETLSVMASNALYDM